MVTVAVSLPPALVAVTVYAVEETTTVGAPLIWPVDVSMLMPFGRDGETDQDVTVPPLEVGVTEVIGVPFVRVKELGV